MEKLSTYNIAFKGLAEGVHVFDYLIGNQFFESFENSLVDQANIKAEITLEKRNTFLSLHLLISGTVRLTCDRCLEWYDHPVKNKADLIIKFGEVRADDGEEVIWLHPDDFQFNVAQIIYEYICLSVPLKHVHPVAAEGETGCNREMLKKLEELSHPVVEKSDERWDQLKNFLNKN